MVNRKIIGLLFFTSTLLITLLSAKENIHEYKVSYVGMSMDYKEYKDGVLLDSETSGFSDLKGVEFLYGYIMPDKTSLDSNKITLSVMALRGNTKYTGSYLGSNLGYGDLVSTTSNEVYDIDLDFAHAYQLSSSYKVIFSLGLGYRFWRRALSPQQVEDYKWYSFRPSLAYSYSYKGLRITPKVEYQYGIKSRMRATGFNEEFRLGGADIIQLSIPLEYFLAQNISIFGVYTFEYQKIKESKLVYDNLGNGYLEPQSKAYNEYIKFGLSFKY